jgi:hypothetical protein
MTRLFKTSLALFAAAALPMTAASADPRPEREALRAACADDAQRLCPDAQGRDRHQCMKAHHDELSQTCQEAIAARRADHQEAAEAIKAACADDAQRLCPDTQGRDRLQCMRTHREELSQTCQDTIAAHRPGKGKGKGKGEGKRDRN